MPAVWYLLAPLALLLLGALWPTPRDSFLADRRNCSAPVRIIDLFHDPVAALDPHPEVMEVLLDRSSQMAEFKAEYERMMNFRRPELEVRETLPL
jgi:hypothetical protein